MISFILKTLLLLNIFLVVADAQIIPSSSRPAEKGNCDLNYSIVYVKSGQKESIYSDESKDRVWLEFTNKSKKTLKILASDDKETLDFLRGVSKEVALYYEVVEKEYCTSKDKEVKELPLAYTRRESYYAIDLKPGQSFIFNVAQQYLSSNKAIYITYECLRGCSKEEKGKSQKAYYFSSELPKNNQKKADQYDTATTARTVNKILTEKKSANRSKPTPIVYSRKASPPDNKNKKVEKSNLLAKYEESKRSQIELAELILGEFLNDPDDLAYVYLLRNNFLSSVSIDSINKNRNAKIKLIDSHITGEALYFFKNILINKNSATVEFGRTWRSKSRRGFSETIHRYTCEKSNGKWNCNAAN